MFGAILYVLLGRHIRRGSPDESAPEPDSQAPTRNRWSRLVAFMALAVIVQGSVPSAAYPGFLSANPWHKRIQNVLYDAVDDKIIVQASDGLWIADADLAQAFRTLELDVPIFVMGATVFEPYGAGGHLVGSFAGLFHWRRSTGRSIDLLTREEVTGVASLRPAEHMITGYFRTPQGEEFVATFEQGIVPVGGAEANGRFRVPEALTGEFRMPLWNYLFEIHNGRFFKDVIGGWHILVIPAGSLLFVLITLSGIYDWVYLKVVRRSPTRASANTNGRG